LDFCQSISPPHTNSHRTPIQDREAVARPERRRRVACNRYVSFGHDSAAKRCLPSPATGCRPGRVDAANNGAPIPRTECAASGSFDPTAPLASPATIVLPFRCRPLNQACLSYHTSTRGATGAGGTRRHPVLKPPQGLPNCNQKCNHLTCKRELTSLAAFATLSGSSTPSQAHITLKGDRQ
jgi:hypothetical protein